MKTFVPFVALAAGVSATFIHAPPFTCPANTDNQCTDKQKPGFSWDDLDFGDFFDYGGFHFRGWKCEDASEKRGRFAPRTFKKAIGGTCHSDKSQSPSFGCGPNVDKFSLGSIHVKPEFDCDLEFHYDMPDGSICKHRSPCSKSGTTVHNTQCGGAKNVTIVYPPQPNKPKPSCSIQVPTISFDCSTASSTQPPKTKTKTTETPGTSTPPADATTTTTTSEVEASSTSTAETGAPPAQTSTEVVPGSSTTVSVPEVTSTSSVSPGEETGSSSSIVNPPASESSDSSIVIVPPVTKTITTSFDSTSTIFTTSIQTITSCAPEKSAECPANSVSTTVVTIAISTTVCPVTETRTTVESQPTVSGVAPTGSAPSAPSGVPSDSTPGSPSGVVPSGVTSAVPGAGTTSTRVSGGGDSSSSSSSAVSSAVSSVSPVETLPCPAIVPSCLNTFLFSVGCSDNTDAACYCPDATFVKNVYDCLYAHGESDAIIAEAIAYFQGICGNWAGQNPAIATGATITTYITVTATPTVAPVYTTVTVDVTTVVPCTNDAGEVIPSSSTTVTVSTSLTVPQVGFTSGSSDVDVIPVTSAPPAVTTSALPAGDSGSSSPAGPGAVVTANGTFTGITTPSFTSSPRPTDSTVVVAGSGRVTASFGLAAALAFFALAL
ncbi:hypothetical protein MYCTH_2297802 [Thermothelomyces thermophilus ATCC 42464]|uniref:CFEM domain-containing protein n=1 Tax=Thermothelomyces thermophilus (strain ATCC 42464 / BCRC 31852 / DSM 1799) TaxID=573729 RepID=G2Q707_THET4|nr:uncharacterized protein MYCTH_2297802 [Thermothelomyces thermophilus ATCC 42464]AEO54787.1 hypothetical protein MYCTH_2297802 [Thermothelomyces thermophilus ATCC 42464]